MSLHFVRQKQVLAIEWDGGEGVPLPIIQSASPHAEALLNSCKR